MPGVKSFFQIARFKVCYSERFKMIVEVFIYIQVVGLAKLQNLSKRWKIWTLKALKHSRDLD